MKLTTFTHLLPLAIASYSTVCTAAMLWWSARATRTARGYQTGLLIYLAVFALPIAVLIVPASFSLHQRAGSGTAWAFLLTSTSLGQLLPMLASHGLCAMKWPETWRRILAQREAVSHRGKCSAKPALRQPGMGSAAS